MNYWKAIGLFFIAIAKGIYYLCTEAVRFDYKDALISFATESPDTMVPVILFMFWFLGVAVLGELVWRWASPYLTNAAIAPAEVLVFLFCLLLFFYPVYRLWDYIARKREEIKKAMEESNTV